MKMRSPLRRHLLHSSRDDFVQSCGGNGGDNGSGDEKVEEFRTDFGGQLIKCSDELDLEVEEKEDSRTFFRLFCLSCQVDGGGGEHLLRLRGAGFEYSRGGN